MPLERKIHKYPLDIVGIQTLKLPAGSIVRGFDTSPDKLNLCIWVDHYLDSDPMKSDRMVPREFHIYGTGHTIPSNLNFHDMTIQGDYVWHLFERDLS